MRKSEIRNGEETFIEGELKYMGAGDPNGKPGTRSYQDGQ